MARLECELRRFEILTAVTVKSIVFCDVTLRSQIEVDWSSRNHLQVEE
jgi:hypothetical protein